MIQFPCMYSDIIANAVSDGSNGVLIASFEISRTGSGFTGAS